MSRTNYRRSLGGGLRYHIFSLAQFSKQNLGLLGFLLLFLCGFGGGVWVVLSKSSTAANLLNGLMEQFVQVRQTQTIFSNVLSSVSSMLLYLVILYICGYCAISQPIILLLPLFKGLGHGVTIAYLYAAYKLNGVAYAAIFILPEAVLTAIIIALACKDSLRLSLAFFRRAFPKDGGEEVIKLKEHTLRYILLLLFTVLTSVLQGILYFFFSNRISL